MHGRRIKRTLRRFARRVQITDKRHIRLADDYLTATREGKSALVVAPTHAEGRDVTGIIRAKLSHLAAASATWALNVAMWDFRFRAMITPFLNSQ